MAAMVELIAGPLIGDLTSIESLARAETLFSNIQSQGARLPSQRRYKARKQSLTDGIEISEALYFDLQNLLLLDSIIQPLHRTPAL